MSDAYHHMWCRKTVAANCQFSLVLKPGEHFWASNIGSKIHKYSVLFCFVVNDSINQAELLLDKRYVSYTLLIPEAVCFGSTFMNPHPLDTRENYEAFQDVFDPDFRLHKGLQSESQCECV